MKKLLYIFVVFGLLACTEQNEPSNSIELTNPNAKAGALPGKFSVSSTNQVQFSQGNLQYLAKKKKWRFTINQYDCIGSDNNKISSSFSGWIDLFCWGTGNNPTNASTDINDYTTFLDWGINAINNGGNETNQWRTLSKDEWVYLFYGRANAATLFGLGSVNGVNGLILLPDQWKSPESVTFTESTNQGLEDTNSNYFFNNEINAFLHNSYTIEQWSVMESVGAVFLPAAGRRFGNDVYDVATNGYYWSMTTPLEECSVAYLLLFNSNRLDPRIQDCRYQGFSVRLARYIQVN